MKEFIKNHKILLFIIALSVLIFSPGLVQFFLSDDWFHLKLVNISNISEFFNFFSPVSNPQSTAFYRPIPNQLFFFVFYTLFGLNPFFYHLFVYILFATTLYLFYLFLTNMKFSKKSALISVLIIGFSHTNFSRLYFLSAAQEIMLLFFILLGLLSNQKKQTNKQIFISAGFYALALLCKDSAIVFPVIVVLIDFIKDKKLWLKKLFVLGLVSLVYLYVRVFLFGFSVTLEGHETYVPSFSPRVLFNTFYMYSLWALGGAELLQDYMNTPVTLIARYWSDFGLIGKIMISTLTAFGSMLIALFIKNIKNLSKIYILSLSIFLIGLLPVIFFPLHKFTIQMSVSMLGFAMFISLLLKNESKRITTVIISIFIILNITSIFMTYRGHYTVQRSKISSNVYNYLLREYPQVNNDTTFVILNSNTTGSEIVTWGSSKQISYALMDNNFFEVLYLNQNVKVIYQDFNNDVKLEVDNNIYLSSDLFLE